MATKAREPAEAEPSCLFPTDEEIARTLFGDDKALTRAFLDHIALEERLGMPRKHPQWGRRYWPAVKAYFDYQWGLAAQPPSASAEQPEAQLDDIFRPIASAAAKRSARKRAS
jgi:hypothetical protein